MTLFEKKYNKIAKKLDHYFNCCDECYNLFEKAFGIYVNNNRTQGFDSTVQKAHDMESAADDLRHEIEFTLYGKALLPESRGDILGLVEAFDSLPNTAETILFSLSCEHISIPLALHEDYRKLAAINVNAYHLVRKSADNLLHNPRITLLSTKDVDEEESASDRVEREIISKIFSSGYDMAVKLLLRDLVLLIGNISDQAEKTADRIAIIAIKRQI